MTRIITTLHLSEIQKEILAKTKASHNPQMAWEEISNTAASIDDNFASARDTLADLGLLTVGDGTLEVTEKGISVMRDSNIVDETGELTQDGLAFAGKDRTGQGDAQQQQQPPAERDEFDMSLESCSLLRTINDSANGITRKKLVEAHITQFTPAELNLIKRAVKGDDHSVTRLEQNSALMNKIYEYVIGIDPNWIPHGIQTGDDGDVGEWIIENLAEIFS